MKNLLQKRLELFKKVDIYPVITSSFCLNRSPVYVLEQLLAAGAKIIQLREKDPLPSDRDLFKLAKIFRKKTSNFGALLIIDDRLDVALLSGADGIHLGQNDLPCAEVRKFAPDLLIGVSTHSPSEIISAQKSGASYINIGPVFSTKTKSGDIKPVGIENLKKWLPLVKMEFSVMGGIKEENILTLYNIGCRKFAMVTELTQSTNIRKKYQRLKELLITAKGNKND